jgi:hypothetical protein
MIEGLGIVIYGFDSLVGRFILMGENWTKQNIIDLCFTKV